MRADSQGWVRLRDLLGTDLLEGVSEDKLLTLAQLSNVQKRRYEMRAGAHGEHEIRAVARGGGYAESRDFLAFPGRPPGEHCWTAPSSSDAGSADGLGSSAWTLTEDGHLSTTPCAAGPPDLAAELGLAMARRRAEELTSDPPWPWRPSWGTPARSVPWFAPGRLQLGGGPEPPAPGNRNIDVHPSRPWQSKVSSTTSWAYIDESSRNGHPGDSVAFWASPATEDQMPAFSSTTPWWAPALDGDEPEPKDRGAKAEAIVELHCPPRTAAEALRWCKPLMLNMVTDPSAPEEKAEEAACWLIRCKLLCTSEEYSTVLRVLSKPHLWHEAAAALADMRQMGVELADVVSFESL